MFFKTQAQREYEGFKASIDDRLGQMARAIKQVVEDQEKLDSDLERLRGVVYGRRLHKQPITEEAPEEPEPPQGDTARMSKDELRRYLTQTGRIVPGKPTIHE